MFKKIVAIALILIMIFSVTNVFATEIDSRVVLGADITEKERTEILQYFGVADNSVKELTVTNEEERKYLSGIIPDSKIGKKSFSCIFIKVKDDGGLIVDTNNINWCTPQMYMAALATAGVTNAIVSVTAPKQVSGTAALTGVYKAYEDITGVELSEQAKSLGASELVLTGDLADVIGSADSTALVNELKVNLEKTKGMSDDELRGYIKETAKYYNVTLTDAQVEQILSFIRSLANSNIDPKKLAAQLEDMKGTLGDISKAGQDVSGFFASIGKFFEDIANWFTNLFKG